MCLSIELFEFFVGNVSYFYVISMLSDCIADTYC